MGDVRYLHAGGGESEQEKRPRVTGVQRVILESMLEKPQFPRTLLRRKSFEALEEKSLCVENPDGSYTITEAGRSAANAKIGRPAGYTKTEGPWSQLIDHYGGLTPFSELVGCHPNTVSRWVTGANSPTGPAEKMVSSLAKEAKIESPFRSARSR